MPHSLQNYYRIAVHQLPELELLPLIRHVVLLYADELDAKFSFAVNKQTNELIHAAQKPNAALVAHAVHLFANAENGLEKFTFENVNYFTRQLNDGFSLTLGFDADLSSE